MLSIVVLSLTIALALTDEVLNDQASLDYVANWPRNCASARPQSSGFYILQIPNSGLKQFYAYCEVDPGGGHAWTRIQYHTSDTKIMFSRDWNAYKHGFGDIGSDHFIGLEKLYALTHTEPHELWILLEDNKKIEFNLKYAIFQIEDEAAGYALKTLGNYSGLLRDSLRKHVGMQFCTYDKDCFNCAKRHKGGWWFQECFPTFLNGDRNTNRTGIIWYQDLGKLVDYKFSKMSIRPVFSK